MDGDRFERLREILLAAEQLPPADRDPYLRRTCAGDEDLLREARSLLDRDPDADLPPVARTGGVGRLLHPGTPEDPGADTSTGPALPDRIGPYRILGILGEGGMGVVYHAEQEHPIRREVALKLIPAAPGQRSVLGRFDAERGVLALMEHPGIARVLDAGRDDAERPYIVMELVRGRPITEFCRSEGLGLRDRLRLFVGACEAVQYAHQKGIIHRDLKPSNILVTRLEGRAVPKIIDFGIAKIEEDLGLAATVTRAGQIMGTLEYMSPEQAAGRAAEVDTRSDVYTLGALLYEMVSDALPHDVAGLPLSDAVKAILEKPPSPLRAVAPSGASPDRELVSVIMKALEKDPARRYASVAALADDVTRYLAGQPILAHPPSGLYHLKKLVARNRVPFSLAAALFALAISSAIVMGVLLETKQREESRARREADRAESVSGFLRDMLSSVEYRGQEATVLETLDQASREIDGGSLEPGEEAAVRSTLGSAYSTLREYEKAETHLTRSLEINRRQFGERSLEYSEGLLELSELHHRWNIGRAGAARSDSLARLALETRRSLLADHDPGLADALVQVARVGAGGPRVSDSLFVEALRTYRRAPGREARVAQVQRWRALPLFQQGKRAESEAALREALALLRNLHPGDHSEVSACLHDLAFVVADKAVRESLAVEHLAMEERLWGGDHPSLLEPLAMVGNFYMGQGYLDRAEVHFRKAHGIALATYDPGHAEPARHSNNLAALLRRQGKFQEAAELFRYALTTWSGLFGPDNRNITICRVNLAKTLSDLGRTDEAWSLYEEGLAIARESSDSDPGPVAFHLGPMADLLTREGRFPEAEDHARRAVAIWAEIPGHGGGNYRVALTYLGIAQRKLGKLDEAEQSFRAADSLYTVNGRHLPAGLPNRVRLGECLREMGRLEEAGEVLSAAQVQFLEDLGEEDAGYPDLLLAYTALQIDRSDWGDAASLAGEARRLLLAHRPDDPRLARAESLLARILAAKPAVD